MYNLKISFIIVALSLASSVSFSKETGELRNIPGLYMSTESPSRVHIMRANSQLRDGIFYMDNGKYITVPGIAVAMPDGKNRWYGASKTNYSEKRVEIEYKEQNGKCKLTAEFRLVLNNKIEVDEKWVSVISCYSNPFNKISIAKR